MHFIQRMGWLLLLGAFSQTLHACDACGCAVGGNGIGLLNNSNRHFVAMQLSQLHFQNQGHNGSQGSKDYFNQAAVQARFYIKKRWQIAAVIPYKLNIRQGETPITRHGLGDISLSIRSTILKNAKGKFGYRWDIGGGLKAPTGNYKSLEELEDEPAHFNPGTGSWDGILQSQLTLQYGAFGLTTDVQGRFIRPNQANYRFGNQWTGQVMLFWQKVTNIGRITPYVGIYGEAIADDLLDNQFRVAGTGGEGYYATMGVQLLRNEWVMSMQTQLPYYQNYGDGDANNQYRMTLSMARLF